MNSKEEMIILCIVPFLEVILMPNILVIENAFIEVDEDEVYYPIEMWN